MHFGAFGCNAFPPSQAEQPFNSDSAGGREEEASATNGSHHNGQIMCRKNEFLKSFAALANAAAAADACDVL